MIMLLAIDEAKEAMERTKASKIITELASQLDQYESRSGRR